MFGLRYNDTGNCPRIDIAILVVSAFFRDPNLAMYESGQLLPDL